MIFLFSAFHGIGFNPIKTVFPSLPLQRYSLRGDDVILMTEMKLRSAEETECEEHAFATEIQPAN